MNSEVPAFVPVDVADSGPRGVTGGVPVSARRSPGWSRALPSLILVASCAGCTQDQAGVFGKAVFGGMIVALIVIPAIFYREWRRGAKR